MLVLSLYITCLVSSWHTLFLFFLYLCHFGVKLCFLYTSLPPSYLFNFSYPRLSCNRQSLDLHPRTRLLLIITHPNNVYVARWGNYVVPITHEDTVCSGNNIVTSPGSEQLSHLSRPDSERYKFQTQIVLILKGMLSTQSCLHSTNIESEPPMCQVLDVGYLNINYKNRNNPHPHMGNSLLSDMFQGV